MADCFRRQSFGSLVGIRTLFHRAGALISLAVSGWIFYQTPNHNLVLVIVSPMLLQPGAAFALARRALPPVSLSVKP